MEFNVGDRVIYPNHGVGVIEEVLTRSVSGDNHQFYSLRLLSSESTVLVPIENTKHVGLRRMLPKKDVQKVFRVLSCGDDRKKGGGADWKGRYQENCEKMRTGEIFEVAVVFRSLSLLSQTKALSFREKRMLDRARDLLVSEICEVSQSTRETVEGRIDRAISTCLKTELEH